MKRIKNVFISTLLLACTFALATGCDADKKESSSAPLPSVSANEIITQSIAQMENMMGIEKKAEATKATAYVAPNYNVDYAHERLSVLRGSGSALYFTEYLANDSYDFETDTVYKDTVVAEGMTLQFYAKKSIVEGGVHVSLEMHQIQGDMENVSPIQIYFDYDYKAQKPSKTTIVSASETENFYDIAVAQFDYSTKIAYSYNFQILTSDTTALKEALTGQSLDFEKFSTYLVGNYVFAKLHTDTNTIESYGYKVGQTDEVNATSEQVSELYETIYAEVKNACVPVALLDTSTVVEKVYYVDMYAYAINLVMQIK